MTDAKLDRIIELLEKLVAASDGPTMAPQAPQSELYGPISCQLAIDTFLQQKSRENTPQHVKNSALILKRLVGDAERDRQLGSVVSKATMRKHRGDLIAAGLSNTTVNQHLAIWSAFSNWAVSMGYLEENPVVGLKLKQGKAAREQRQAFSKDDIEQLFGPGWFRCTPDGTARRWLPLIMLYTGARPEEVAQLRGHFGPGKSFDMATLEDGQRRKNIASRRLVPVHTKLIELGIEELPKRGSWFPELNPGSNGRLAEAPSRWFNDRWLRPRIKNRKKVLYSIRHSVTTQLKVERGVHPSVIAQLVGHVDESQTTGRYGKEYRVETLREAVESLEWPVEQRPRREGSE